MVRSIPRIVAPLRTVPPSSQEPISSIREIRQIRIPFALPTPALTLSVEQRGHTKLTLPWLENLGDAMIGAGEMELRLAIAGSRNRAPNLRLQRHELAAQLRFSVF